MQTRIQRSSKSQHASQGGKACGHPHHVGTCSCCQRAQLERWNTQLAQVSARQRGQH